MCCFRMNKSGTSVFYRGSVTVGTGEALLFVSAATIGALIGCTEIYIDGTFRCVPGIFKQLVTIQAVKNDKVMFVI